MTRPEEVDAAFPELSAVGSIGVPSGQKEVFRAIMSGEPVVVKLVKPSHDPSTAARVEREVQAAAELQSAYVPQVHNLGRRGVSGIERIFIIEDLIEGRTLQDELVARGRLPLAEVLRLGRALLLACCDFARANLIHRDIKPANLILDTTGKIWVIDFGLVRFLDLESLTATAAGFGPFTPGYAPPEQFRNRKSELDGRADLFAVGIVLHEALSGSNFHQVQARGDIFQLLRSVEASDLPPLIVTGDPEGNLGELILSLGSRFLSRRPPNAVDALAWLDDVEAALSTRGTDE